MPLEPVTWMGRVFTGREIGIDAAARDVKPAEVRHLLDERIGQRLFGENACHLAEPFRVGLTVVALAQFAVRSSLSQ